MKAVIYALLAGLLAACRPEARDTIAPAYEDWYVLRSPDERTIEAVWGDIDQSVVISTMFTLYRTTDRGKSWERVHQQSNGLMGLASYRDTLFATSGLRITNLEVSLVNPALYSTDLGKTWSSYRRFNPIFELFNATNPKGITIDPVAVPNSGFYKVRRQYLDDSTKSIRRFITPGVVMQTGRRIDLPNLHQLASLALDGKGRLYIAGSDQVCETSPNVRYCNGGRGVVYVSKNPLP